MGLAGTVVTTAGKAAVSGTKTLAKGTTSAVSGVAKSASKGVSNLVNSSKSKSGRGQQAESMMKRVVGDLDTTGKTSDGYNY